LVKKGSLASFNDVSDETPKEQNINVNVNNNINELLDTNKTKPIVTGIYFDPEVLSVLDEVSKGKKGAKTKIVNEAVKLYLQQNGLM
jgi:hypothetical protein